MSGNGYTHTRLVERQHDILARLYAQQRENSQTILFLATALGKALAERDRARDLACRLEAELARQTSD